MLGLDPSRPIDCEQGLFDLGMDSLMAIQIRSGLEAAVGRRLPSSVVFNYPTISALARYLGTTDVVAPSVAAPIPAPSTEVAAGAAADESLSEDELAAMLADRLRQMAVGDSHESRGGR